MITIINHSNGLKNDLHLIDDCPVCGNEVHEFIVDYGYNYHDDYGWSKPVYIKSGNSNIIVKPCGHTVEDGVSFHIYRFPRTKGGKCAYNKQLFLSGTSSKSS